MAQSAFQVNAFQSNAFQVFDTHDGGFGSGGLKKRHKKAEQLQSLYSNISVETPESRALISAVDPFIEPETDEEWTKRAKAQYITNKTPKASRINFQALYENNLARERLLNALDVAKAQIQAYKEQQEEEAIIIMLMMEF